ncbi:DUF6447 family protein [Alphaproteobacteria bacterium]|nr:DUF6447 family protein [Alphaproteobacteria bacterium]
MPNVQIDGIRYNSEDLSDNGRALLFSLEFAQQQINKLEREIATYELARKTYIASLTIEIEKEGIQPLQSIEAEVPLE